MSCNVAAEAEAAGHRSFFPRLLPHANNVTGLYSHQQLVVGTIWC